LLKFAPYNKNIKINKNTTFGDLEPKVKGQNQWSNISVYDKS